MLAQITWYHNIALMDKVKTAEEHIWYEDPYVFDFIPFREDMLERDIEQALVRDVTKLLTKDAGHDSITKLSLMRRQAPNRNRNKRRRLPGGRPQKDF